MGGGVGDGDAALSASSASAGAGGVGDGRHGVEEALRRGRASAGDRDLDTAIRESQAGVGGDAATDDLDLDLAIRKSLGVARGDTATAATAAAASAGHAPVDTDCARGVAVETTSGAVSSDEESLDGRKVSRRVGQQKDRRRPLRRQKANAAPDQLQRPVVHGDEDESLSYAVGGMVLSDAEEGVRDGDVAARARRVLQRSESELSLGHADAALAARTERTSMSLGDPEGSAGTVACAAEPLRVNPVPSTVSHGAGAVSPPAASYGPDQGRRRSTRIAARTATAAGYLDPSGGDRGVDAAGGAGEDSMLIVYTFIQFLAMRSEACLYFHPWGICALVTLMQCLKLTCAR